MMGEHPNVGPGGVYLQGGVLSCYDEDEVVLEAPIVFEVVAATMAQETLVVVMQVRQFSGRMGAARARRGSKMLLLLLSPQTHANEQVVPTYHASGISCRRIAFTHRRQPSVIAKGIQIGIPYLYSTVGSP